MGGSLRRRTATAALTAALAGLLLLPGAAAGRDAPFVPWTDPLPGVPMPFEPSREADCQSGDSRCIERTLFEMYRRFDRLYASCDHNSLFGLVYIRVTEAIRRALKRGFYEEPRFLQHEDAVFARMYFVAYDRWARGRRSQVPSAWQAAFDAARARRVNAVGNLLMSMNAHVNRDMPFMLANLGLTMPDGRSRKPDHDRGNAVLHPLYDDTFRELERRYDPTTRNYDDPDETSDDLVLFQVLPAWREQVWRHAEMLRSASTPAARRAIASYIESYALQIGRTIESQTRITSSAARDAHCRRYRATHRERGALARPRIRHRRLRASRRWRIPVRIRCPRGIRWCDGTLALERHWGAFSGRRLRAIRPGRAVTVQMPLGPRMRRALRRHGKLRVWAVTRTATPWGLPVKARQRATLRKPRPR